MDDPFADALARHHAGDLTGAEQLYRALLGDQPLHADALHLLGVLLHQTGRHEEALECIARSLALVPSAAAYTNQGSVLRVLGRLDAALSSHAEASRLAPDLAAAHMNKAEVLMALARHAEALESCDRALALRADHVDTWVRRGNALQALGRQADALASYDRALALRPTDALALTNRGVALEALGRAVEALDCYDQALKVQDDARTHANRGNALHALGAHGPAVDSYAKAIALGLDDAVVWCTRGNALLELARPEEALASYDRAVTLRPVYVEAWNNRGNALRALSRYDDALASYARALALDPEAREARVNTGNVMQIVNRHPEAVICYDIVLASDADHVDAHWNGALCRLALGDFQQGWREFEWRHRLMAPRDYVEPLWLGQEFAPGTTILLHAEQGFGDTLQFCRYAPMVAALGARVVMEVQPELKRLLAGLPWVERVVAQGEATGPFDLHCPLLSLPLAFGTTAETVPDTVPYLRADPTATEEWRARLAVLPGVKVGLVWAGNPRSFNQIAAEMDRRRSLALEQYAPLADVSGVTLLSLQKDTAGEQARMAPAGMVLHDWTAELTDFADTAALVAALDLVIGVDTSVVHVAGALGVPVWILNRHGACWRWLRNRTDTLWYPNARLFRQARTDDWGPVTAEVAEALRGVADTGVITPSAVIARSEATRRSR
jgi:tetratricopeptide (TPR) repeat protein